MGSVDTTNGQIGGLERQFPGNVQVDQLTNELKYLFVGRSCDGGSPRISLLITPAGNPKNAHEICGYVGTGAFGGGWNHTDADGGRPGAKTNSCLGS